MVRMVYRVLNESNWDKKIFIYNILRASRKLLASPSNPHNYYLIQTKDNQRQPEKRTDTLYLWPRSKV